MSDVIDLHRDKNIVTVELNRPESHNAMTPEMIQALTETFRQLAADDSLRVVVLTGKGRSFCAGADLEFMRAAADASYQENVAESKDIFDLMLAVDQCPHPVIGRVNGAAIGGGVGLVSCCDIAVAVEGAIFALSEVRLGLAPAVISPFVISKIGVGAARELFLTGERFKAPTAQRIGLIHHVVADAVELDRKVSERIAALLAGGPAAQAAIKTLIAQVAFRPKDDMANYTSRVIADRRASQEGQEGMSSFLEKREPRWRH